MLKKMTKTFATKCFKPLGSKTTRIHLYLYVICVNLQKTQMSYQGLKKKARSHEFPQMDIYGVHASIARDRYFKFSMKNHELIYNSFVL